MIINLTPTLRIEDGPRRVKATATAELLDDAVTAKHYKEGQPDSQGKPIKLGEEMEYVDYRNRKKPGGMVFNLYQLRPDDNPNNNLTERWFKVDSFDTLEAATEAAHALMGDA